MNVLVATFNMAVIAGMGLPHHHVAAIGFEHTHRSSVQGGEGLTRHNLLDRADRKAAVGQVEHTIHVLNNRVDFVRHENHRDPALAVEPVNQLRHGVLVVQI